MGQPRIAGHPVMEAIERYLEDARALGIAAFRARHGDRFLLKTPQTGSTFWDSPMDFQTQSIPFDTVQATMEPEPLLDMSDDFSSQWGVLVVRKNPDNPFPDRISVGRARRSDLVLRLSFVSKLHAHFLVDEADGVVRILDQKSANGTRINGRVLEPSVPAALEVGDQVGFGPRFALVYLDAKALIDRLLVIPT